MAALRCRAGITFPEGPAAKAKWHEFRNKWLGDHDYDLRSPDDWNPMHAPVAAPRLPAAK